MAKTTMAQVPRHGQRFTQRGRKMGIRLNGLARNSNYRSGIIVKENSVVDGCLNKTDALTRASNEHKLIVEVRANAKLTK